MLKRFSVLLSWVLSCRVLLESHIDKDVSCYISAVRNQFSVPARRHDKLEAASPSNKGSSSDGFLSLAIDTQIQNNLHGHSSQPCSLRLQHVHSKQWLAFFHPVSKQALMRGSIHLISTPLPPLLPPTRCCKKCTVMIGKLLKHEKSPCSRSGKNLLSQILGRISQTGGLESIDSLESDRAASAVKCTNSIRERVVVF